MKPLLEGYMNTQNALLLVLILSAASMGYSQNNRLTKNQPSREQFTATNQQSKLSPSSSQQTLPSMDFKTSPIKKFMLDQNLRPTEETQKALELLMKQGPDVSGGGTKEGLSFQAAALRGLQNLKPGILDEATSTQVLEKIKSSKFISLKETLSVTDGYGHEQEVMAVNVPQIETVYFTGSKADNAREDILQGIALHEVLSLMKIEKTGDYHISAQLKNSMTDELNAAIAMQVAGLNTTQLQAYQKELFDQMKSTDSERTPFEILKELFETAPRPATTADFLQEKETYNKKELSGAFYNYNLSVLPSTTRSNLEYQRSLYNTRYYFVFGHVNRITSEYVQAQPGGAGNGPLFPPTPAVPAREAKCESLMDIRSYVQAESDRWKLNTIQATDPHCSYNTFGGIGSDYEIKLSQTQSEFIKTFEFKNFQSPDYGKRIRKTTYYRISGSLLAIKIVYEILETHEVQISYDYAWK
jgi:hypothetical protein